MAPSARIILTDGSSLENYVDEADVLVISFSRREVEACRVGDAVDRLMHLSDDPSRVKRFEGAVLFQFEGYDNDRREVTQIPECRAYFKALCGSWNFWLHFLGKDHEKAIEQIGLMIALQTPLKALPPINGLHSFALDPNAMNNTVRRLFASMEVLHAQHGISASEHERIVKQTNAILDAAFS